MNRRQLVAGLTGLSIVAVATPAAAQEPRFDPSTLSPGLLRILQAALALSGHYAGVLDGAWGPASRQALEDWRAAQAWPGPPMLGPLLQGWQAAVARDNWSAVTLQQPAVSLLLPLALVQPRRGATGVSAFADEARSLELRVAEGSRAEVDELHALTLAMAPGGQRQQGGRGASAWRSSEVMLAPRQQVLVRSLALAEGGDREAALSLTCAAPRLAAGRLIWASFSRGPAMAVLPPKGAGLDRLRLP